jgi:hypothetical protein
LAGLLVAAASTAKEERVNLADEAERERETVPDAGESVFEGGDVVADLGDVVHGGTGLLVEFEEEEVGQRGLGALDHGGEHGLLANVAVEEEGYIRQKGGDTVHTAQGHEGLLKAASERRMPVDGRLGRQRGRDKGPNRLPEGGCGLVVAWLFPLHEGNVSVNYIILYEEML